MHRPRPRTAHHTRPPRRRPNADAPPARADEIEEKEYAVEFVHKKPGLRNGRLAFKVRWQGYGPEHDEWVEFLDERDNVKIAHRFHDWALKRFRRQMHADERAAAQKRARTD